MLTVIITASISTLDVLDIQLTMFVRTAYFGALHANNIYCIVSDGPRHKRPINSKDTYTCGISCDLFIF